MIDKETAEYVAKKVFDRFKKQTMDQDDFASTLLELINNPPYVGALNRFVQEVQYLQYDRDVKELLDPMFSIMWKLQRTYTKGENMVLTNLEDDYLVRVLKENRDGS
jgi:hypothetical protein